MLKKSQYYFVCIAGSLLVASIYLATWWFLLISLFFGCLLAKRIYARDKNRMKDQEFFQDFRFFLEDFIAKLNGGYNVTSSFFDSYRKRSQKGEYYKLLHLSYQDYLSGQSFQACLHRLEEEVDYPLFKQFFSSLILVTREGGDLVELATCFHQILLEKKELMEDRKAKLKGSKREQSLMLVMPLILMGALSSSGFVSKDLTFLDILIRCISLLFFILAWLWSESIVKESYS